MGESTTVRCVATRVIFGRLHVTTCVRWLVVRLTTIGGSGSGLCVAVVLLLLRRHPGADAVVRLLVPELILVLLPRLEWDRLRVELALILEKMVSIVIM